MKHLKHFDKETQKEILSGHVIINHKIDLHAFGVEVLENSLLYYGKEGKSLTDRKLIMVDFYNDAIDYFESIKTNLIAEKEFKNKLFFMEFWASLGDNLRRPQIEPKHDFILSYAKENKKVIPPNNKIMQKFADVANIDPPPVIWDGILTKDQQQFLFYLANKDTQFTLKDYEEIQILFPKEVQFIKSFNFEGFVIYYEDFGNVWKMAKIIDPEYTKQIKSKSEANHNVLDNNILLVFNKNIIKDFYSKIQLEGVFSFWDFFDYTLDYYLNNHPNVLKNILISNTFFDIFYEKIPSNILEKIQDDSRIRELFKVLFIVYTSKRRIPILEDTNNIIEEIKIKFDLTNVPKVSVDSENVPELETSKEDSDETEKHYKTLIPGRFQPPHFGHIRMYQDFCQYDPVFVIIYSKNNPLSIFSPDQVVKLFKKYVELGYLPENTEFVVENTGYLPEIIEKHGWEVKQIISGDDRIEGYRKQFPEDTDIVFDRSIRYYRGKFLRMWLQDPYANKDKIVDALGNNEDLFDFYLKTLNIKSQKNIVSKKS